MIQIFSKEKQASGVFNGGQIVENKPVGFPGEGGSLRAFSNLFYWAHARAVVDSTIGLHPHQGFEICSFVLKGPIRHFDTKLRDWRPLDSGDVQIIRAGSGISHAEFMGQGAEMFQIWFDPNLQKTLPEPASYDDYRSADFPISENNGLKIKTLVGPRSPFSMATPGVEVWRVSLEADAKFDVEAAGKKVAAYVIEGQAKIGDEAAEASDFVLASGLENVEIQAIEAADVFVMRVLERPGYATYASQRYA